jgi:energy-coupling factor transporter ATP-binding protein EcfA2
MHLTSVTINRVGPFYHETKLLLDEEVTILTGANDTGKSSVLSCLRILLTDRGMDEMEVNQDYLQESPGKWTEDQTITVSGEFRIDDRNEVPVDGYIFTPGDSATLLKRVGLQTGKTKEALIRSKHHGNASWAFKLPVLVDVQSTEKVRDLINLKSPNSTESALLNTAFGGFNHEKLSLMQSLNFNRSVRAAEERLNAHMKRVMPMEGTIRFSLQPMDGKRDLLGVYLSDRNDGITPFGCRGSGVQKMITFFSELITKAASAHHRIILIDEPENSLHADAQHLLRELLYSLASQKNTQVIYTTHSPSMVNPARPTQIRLLRRQNRDGHATSVIEMDVHRENFFGLRSSLGLSAGDSLLFAPVTVIVEGDTEILCLSQLFTKLEAAGIPGFDESKKLLSLTHFLDGSGDSFDYLTRLAESHGTRVILFLDGDKRNRVKQKGLEQKHPNARFIFCDDNSEFEELVPEEFYFQAIAELLDKKASEGSDLRDKWEASVSQNPNRQRLAFSKRVFHWVEEEFPEFESSKASLMTRAIQLTPPEKIKTKPLAELLIKIREMLEKTSFD